MGSEGLDIVKRCQRKLYQCFRKEKIVKFNVQYKTTKLCFFTSTKDRTPLLSNSSVVYKFKCPGCSKMYIGETQCTLYKRTVQHAHEQKTSAIYKHLECCHGYEHIKSIHSLDNIPLENDFQINIVRNNTTIIARSDNWLNLLFMESLMIKEHNPELNTGIKATKALQLF